MPTVWGTVDDVVTHMDGSAGIVVKTTMSMRGEFRMYVGVEPQTLVARGLQRIYLSDLKIGEHVELSYESRANRLVLVAETIYIRPDHGTL